MDKKIPNSAISACGSIVFIILYGVFKYIVINDVSAIICLMCSLIFAIICIVQIMYTKYKRKKKLDEELQNMRTPSTNNLHY